MHALFNKRPMPSLMELCNRPHLQLHHLKYCTFFAFEKTAAHNASPKTEQSWAWSARARVVMLQKGEFSLSEHRAVLGINPISPEPQTVLCWPLLIRKGHFSHFLHSYSQWQGRWCMQMYLRAFNDIPMSTTLVSVANRCQIPSLSPKKGHNLKYRIQHRKQFIRIPPQLPPLYWPFQCSSCRLWWTHMGCCSLSMAPGLQGSSAPALREELPNQPMWVILPSKEALKARGLHWLLFKSLI